MAPLAAALLVLGLASAAWAQSKSGSTKKKKLEHLTIVDARFLDAEDGYPLPPNSTFYPGDNVYLNFRIGGFYVAEYEYQMKISYRVEFIGPRGEPFAETEAGEVAQEVYPQDEKWMPVVRTGPRIPFHAEAGEYKIAIYAHDGLKPQEEARQELVFQVKGKDVGETAKLTVRNFKFQRTESGEAVADPIYRQGETLFGSFYITGFELAKDNAFNVDSKLQVVNSEGDVLYSFSPEDETGQSFYPRRWIPGHFRVNLDKNIPAGEYAIVLSVTDAVGKQESESRFDFRIR